tara:strand:+ start:1027 stop:2451 length:1425 start_codon:yes stop_codon:yes gene_type:complete
MTLRQDMSDVGDLSDYYWRLLTNIDMGNGQPFGFWTLVSLFCILSGLALMYLTVLIYRANPSSAKNRFIALMLFAESIRCLTGSFFYIYPFNLEQVQFLYFIRLIFYTSGVMLILLYLTAPLLYIKNKFAQRVMRVFETKAILLMPVLGFVIFAVASFAMGGFPYGGIAPSIWIYCAEAGPGIGGTTSGGTVPFEPVCPESYSELYPMMWTITLISPLAQIIFILPLVAAFTTAVIITRTTKEIFKTGSESERNEIRAVRLGFIGKTIFQFFSLMCLIIFLVLSPVTGPELSWFNPELFDVDKFVNQGDVPIWAVLTGFTTPFIIGGMVLAGLFEGIVFTYAVMKHEVLGIDERLRKTFSGALFAGLGTIAFLIATELMESVAGMGWIGGVLIGMTILFLRKPIFATFSKISFSIMPESHTKSEQTYLEVFAIAMEDGIITQEERKMLQIQARTLGLNESRITHLESTYHSNDA